MADAAKDGGDETLSGEPLCRLEDIPDGEGKGFVIDGPQAELDVFVIRRGQDVFGYVNSCPHAWTPLDWSPDRFTNMEKTHILCATHGAVFEMETGLCIAGPCKNDRLTPFPVTVTDGAIYAQSEGA